MKGILSNIKNYDLMTEEDIKLRREEKAVNIVKMVIELRNKKEKELGRKLTDDEYKNLENSVFNKKENKDGTKTV
jgi:hypothetical protein